MPPKRAKGLKQSALQKTENDPLLPTNNAVPNEALPSPAKKRARITDQEEPVYIGDIDEENEIEETAMLLQAAKAQLDQDQGRTLLRACIHECTRILATLQHQGDRTRILTVYAMALFWLAAYSEPDEQQMELIDLALELTTENSVHCFLQIGKRIVDGHASIPDDLWVQYSSMSDDLQVDEIGDREMLAWLALRKFKSLDSVKETKGWSKICVRLWENVPNTLEPKYRGLGSIHLSVGSVCVTEQGDLVEQDESLMDTVAVSEAKSVLLEALDWFTKALTESDHPSDLIYQPLGDVHVQLATVHEMLDECANAIDSYRCAIMFFNKAMAYNPDSVDPELIPSLNTCLECLIAET